MPVNSYDPIKPGQQSFVNTPYQYWKGRTDDGSVQYIEFAINGQLFTTPVAADGSWEFQLPLRLEEGGHNLTVRYFDKSGNPGIPLQTYLVVDLSPPDKPAILTVMDDFGAITGPLGNNGFTDDNTPLISGIAEPDSVVRLYSNGMLVGSTQAGPNGLWRIQPELTDGEHRLLVTATDAFNQVSQDSEVFGLFINESRVSKPQLLEVYDNYGPVQGAIRNGEVSDDRTPRLSGSASADAESVEIYANGNRIGIAPVINGQWQWESHTSPLPAGENMLTVRAINGRGELSEPSEPFTYKVVIPDAVTIEYAIDDFGPKTGWLGNHAITDDRTPTLQGKGEPGAVVEVEYRRWNGSWASAGSVKVDSHGTWTLQTPEIGIEGPYHYRARSAYGAEKSAWSETFYLDIFAGTDLPPQILYAADNAGPVQGNVGHEGVTDDRTPTLKGKGVPRTVIEIEYGKAGGPWHAAGSVKVDSSGNWSFTSPQLGSEGVWEYRARTVNGSDKSNWTGKFVLNVYNGADLPPVIVEATDDFGPKTGWLGNHAITDDRTPTLQGKGVPGAVVEVEYRRWNGSWASAGSVKVDSHGTWTLQTPEIGIEGPYHYRARSAYGAEKSAWSETFYLDIFAGTDLPPQILYAADNAGPVQGNVGHEGVTDDRTPTLKGKGVPRTVIEIEYGKAGAPWHAAGSVKVDSSGNWSFTSPQLGSEGVWEYRARTVNGSNKSNWTGKFVLNVYNGADLPPVIVEATDDFGPKTGWLGNHAITDDRTPTLQGKGVPGAVVEVEYRRWNGSWASAGSVKVDSHGTWTLQTPEIGIEGPYHYRARSAYGAEKSAWSETFYLDIFAGTDLPPQILYAADNAGPVQGNVGHEGVTDDRTPTLKGKGVPRTVIEIEYGKAGAPWHAAGSVKVDSSGNWSFTSPQLGSEGVWEYRARTVNGSNKSNWTDKFVLNIADWDVTPRIDYADDNRGAIQGRVYSGGMTDDYTPTLRGKAAPGRIVYLFERHIDERWVPLGTAKADSQGNWSYTTGNMEPWRGLHEFQVSYHPQRDANAEKFRLELNADPLSVGDGLKWDFNDGTLQGWTTAGKYHRNHEAYVKSWSASNSSKELGSATGDASQSGFNSEIVYQYIKVEAGKTYRFAYDAARLSNQGGDGYYAPKIGLQVDGKNVIAPSHLPYGWHNYRGEFTATETKTVRLAMVNETSSGSGNDFALDNISVKAVSGHSRSLLAQVETVFELEDAAYINLNTVLDNVHKASAVSMANSSQNTLTVSVDAVLQAGGKNLFVTDGKQQLRIMGDNRDEVKLDDMADANTHSGSWVQQSGQLTVGGIRYQVFSHSSTEAEVLIQEGVRTEIL